MLGSSLDRASGHPLRQSVRFFCLILALMVCPRASWGDSVETLTPESKNATSLPALELQRKLGFSNLVFRPQHQGRIVLDSGELRILFLEELRRAGFRAVGAESLVFGRDRGQQADLLLGGTVTQLFCESDLVRPKALNCMLEVQWEVLDVRTDEVVYRAHEFHAASSIGQNRTTAELLARALALGNLQGLIARDRFRQLVNAAPPSMLLESVFRREKLKACEPSPTKAPSLPQDAEEVLSSIVVVELDTGFGSGFLISPDGYLLTAAHVVEGENPIIKLKDGQTSSATVLRLDKLSDSALLRADKLMTGSCMPISTDPRPKIGSPVFVMGAPASTELAFSMSQGIVSGIRMIEGANLIQTDASVNPGNSGGPFVSERGEALAIASFKIAGGSMEGLAFGTPIGFALERLGIEFGSETSQALREGGAYVERKAAKAQVDDYRDERPDLQIRRHRLQTMDRKVKLMEQARAELRRERTPPSVRWLRWGGLSLAIGAGLSAAGSAMAAENSNTLSAFDTAQTINDLSWVGLVTGATAFAASFALEPRAPSEREVDERYRTKLRTTGRGTVELEVHF